MSNENEDDVCQAPLYWRPSWLTAAVSYPMRTSSETKCLKIWTKQLPPGRLLTNCSKMDWKRQTIVVIRWQKPLCGRSGCSPCCVHNVVASSIDGAVLAVEVVAFWLRWTRWIWNNIIFRFYDVDEMPKSSCCWKLLTNFTKEMLGSAYIHLIFGKVF